MYTAEKQTINKPIIRIRIITSLLHRCVLFTSSFAASPAV